LGQTKDISLTTLAYLPIFVYLEYPIQEEIYTPETAQPMIKKATSTVKSNMFLTKSFLAIFGDNPKRHGPKGFASGPEVKHAFLELQGIFLT
jgi:hypothetical protein